MAQKHMADITELITPLRKQRVEWLKVVSCPVCGKPSHKSVYKNSSAVDYSHFVKDSFVGKCSVCPTQRTPDLWDSTPLQSFSTLKANLPAEHLSTPPTSG